jgi:hypothetical protein
MKATQVWSQTEDGYVTEMSAMRPHLNLPESWMPEVNKPFPFAISLLLKDYSNNAILGWYCFVNQKKYVVFND